ncbi:MAG: hypothetical protein ABH878_06345 [bacterium]
MNAEGDNSRLIDTGKQMKLIAQSSLLAIYAVQRDDPNGPDYGQILGSGLLFTHNQIPYLITAAHVLSVPLPNIIGLAHTQEPNIPPVYCHS